MEGIEVTLPEMLECRERRARAQDRLIAAYHCPLVSFSMNIPGPVKANEAIRAAFERGKEALLRGLESRGFTVKAQEEAHGATGDELLLSVDAPAEGLKVLAAQIEEAHPVGRLYDMDVIGADGRKLSRPTFRECLICGRQAQECARSRTHPLADLQGAVERLLLGMVESPNDLQ